MFKLILIISVVCATPLVLCTQQAPEVQEQSDEEPSAFPFPRPRPTPPAPTPQPKPFPWPWIKPQEPKWYELQYWKKKWDKFTLKEWRTLFTEIDPITIGFYLIIFYLVVHYTLTSRRTQ